MEMILQNPVRCFFFYYFSPASEERRMLLSAESALQTSDNKEKKRDWKLVHCDVYGSPEREKEFVFVILIFNPRECS